MAAATITNRVETVAGNKRAIFCDAVIADTNTYATGLMKVDTVDFIANQAGKAGTFGCDISGGNLTFGIVSGPLTGKLTIIGV